MTLFDQRPLKPMLAKTGEESFDSSNHLFELKWDGLRTLLFKQGSRIQLQNRNLRDVTSWYPELQRIGASIKARKAIIDGETVIIGPNGIPNFHQMQNRFQIENPKRAAFLGKTIPASYVAFDILNLDGKDKVSAALVERKRLLKSILIEGPHLLYGEHVDTHGKQFYNDALSNEFEGIIAKEKNSQYLPGARSSSWIKIKGSTTIDCVIVGFTKGEGAREPTFGSLVLACYNQKGALQHVGSAGGGFDDRTLEALKEKLARIVQNTATIPKPAEISQPITWVRPSLVCEVRYMNWTTDHKLRFPRFSMLREDKGPEECRLDN